MRIILMSILVESKINPVPARDNNGTSKGQVMLIKHMMRVIITRLWMHQSRLRILLSLQNLEGIKPITHIFNMTVFTI